MLCKMVSLQHYLVVLTACTNPNRAYKSLIQIVSALLALIQTGLSGLENLPLCAYKASIIRSDRLSWDILARSCCFQGTSPVIKLQASAPASFAASTQFPAKDTLALAIYARANNKGLGHGHILVPKSTINSKYIQNIKAVI